MATHDIHTKKFSLDLHTVLPEMKEQPENRKKEKKDKKPGTKKNKEGGREEWPPVSWP